MNKQRRASLHQAVWLINGILDGEEQCDAAEYDACKPELKKAALIVEEARDEEQEYLDNMPEGLAGGEKGDAANEAISNLDTALEMIEYIIEIDLSKDPEEGEEIPDMIDTITEHINDACA